MKAHWSTKEETEVPAGDTAKTATEGSNEDRGFGAGVDGRCDRHVDGLQWNSQSSQ
jgi:hypothetical protein